MKILLVGSGGREHAMAWKLAQSPLVQQLWCAPGNAGIALEQVGSGEKVQCCPVSAEDLPGLLTLAKEKLPDLTVVGPDNPLALGIVDLFQKNGFRIWGPTQKAAQFESSKVFSQAFMEKYGIPTARAQSFQQPELAKRYAAALGGACAVKADGLALGKGVFVCRAITEANAAIDQILTGKTFGEAGAKILIQELLEGVEISIHVLSDGKTARLFPSAQDHKRAFDNDQGPNTGGMGAFCPTPFVNEQELQTIYQKIVRPWLAGCEAEGIQFCGILYPGLMLTKEGPKVLEFNARFGDPETQVYLTRLENDLAKVLNDCVDQRLDQNELRWTAQSSVCVVMASGGYPGSYEKGKAINGLESAGQLAGVKVFHAGTALKEGRIVTNGGRVLGVTALGSTLDEARNKAYEAAGRIYFENGFFRRDIASKGLANIRR